MKKLLCFLLLAIFCTMPTYAAKWRTAKAGDTMWSLSVENRVTIGAICRYNADKKPCEKLPVGAVVYIPYRTSELRQMEREVVELVNAERKAVGLEPLKSSNRIARIARIKGKDLRDNDYFDHTSPTLGTPFEMLKRYGVTYHQAGENLARGQETAKAVVEAWMHSNGHRANILSEKYTTIGVGCCDGVYGPYWVQLFIG